MVDWIAAFSMPLIQNMFIVAAIACVLCGVVGTLVVVKRMVFVTGGIAHTTFGGVGMAYYLMSVFAVSWFTPMIGAAVFAVVSAVIMALPAVSRRMREDSVIGVLWSVGMALGVIFMSLMDRSVVTPRSFESILFGDILLVGNTELKIIAVVTIISLIVIATLFRDLQALTFDETHAKLSGINVTVMNVILYVIIAMTCVVALNVVGIVMVIALITIPAAMSNMFTESLKEMMIVSVILSLIMAFFGLIISIGVDIPPGATVSVTMGVLFVVAIVVKTAFGKITQGKME
ncbi:MAG: metal ABC transporter permease [Candidatus Methanomethylophilaceae archaeon]|nr:zinc transport system permease protein [Candidatus Methanomethylophilaceae archaeon]